MFDANKNKKYKAYHFSSTDVEIGSTIPPKTYGNFSDIKGVVEESLEKVRLEKFPNLNTRLNCVFLAPTEESAREWCRDINILHWRNEQKEVEFFVYAVETQEQPIWFDSELLMSFSFPNAKNDDIANTYWNSGIIDVEPNTTRFLEYMASNEVVVISKTKWKIKINGEIEFME